MTNMRLVVNAILYLIRTGCHWELLPKNFPQKSTVHDYFTKFKNEGVWDKIHDKLRGLVRMKHDRNKLPSAGVIDSQTVKSTECTGERGYDGGKKINGIKRHIVVDVLGPIITAIVLPANKVDSNAAEHVLEITKHEHLRIEFIWADGGYRGVPGMGNN